MTSEAIHRAAFMLDEYNVNTMIGFAIGYQGATAHLNGDLPLPDCVDPRGIERKRRVWIGLGTGPDDETTVAVEWGGWHVWCEYTIGSREFAVVLGWHAPCFDVEAPTVTP